MGPFEVRVGEEADLAAALGVCRGWVLLSFPACVPAGTISGEAGGVRGIAHHGQSSCLA